MTKATLLKKVPLSNEEWAMQQFLLQEKPFLKDCKAMFEVLITRTLYKSWAHDGMSIDEIHRIVLNLIGTWTFIEEDPAAKKKFKDSLKEVPTSNEEWAFQMFATLHRKATVLKFEGHLKKLCDIVLYKSWANENMTLLEISKALDRALALP